MATDWNAPRTLRNVRGGRRLSRFRTWNFPFEVRKRPGLARARH
jgi:hypothetical protein